MKMKKIYRDASTGRIVSRSYADAHPDTTFADTVPVGKEPKVKPEPQAIENEETK